MAYPLNCLPVTFEANDSTPWYTPSFQMGILCHVAIPSIDLEASRDFYVDVLGAKLYREYGDRKTFGLANLQIVTHLCRQEDVIWNPSVYPRHFGLTFIDQQDFTAMVQRAMRVESAILLQPQVRFPDKDECHFTCIVRDPAHNLVEFKWYHDSRYAF